MNIFNLLHKEKPSLKEQIKKWLLTIENEHNLSPGIKAIYFGLFEPYGISLTGSKKYDPNDDDWACEEDYIPKHRCCTSLNIPDGTDWKEVLYKIKSSIEELIKEQPELNLWQVEHIAIGFEDGDLLPIK